jgi:putative membrane protein
MISVLLRWFLNALALFLVSKMVPGVILEDFSAALVAIIIISLLNILIKPILILLTLPITILTLGLFTVIINAVLLLLAGAITPGFGVDGFGAALVGSILFTVISMLLRSVLGEK